MADVPRLHRRATAEFDLLMHAIPPDHWERPTPCADWDVRAGGPPQDFVGLTVVSPTRAKAAFCSDKRLRR